MARLGRQTPTQFITLPYTRTKGNQAVNLYNMTGRTALAWQAQVLRDMMAQTEDGLWTHSRFGYSVPRRNGKTEIIYAREMWGLLTGEKILHTAHRTTTAHSSWEQLYELLKKAGVPIEHTYRANGREHISVRGGGHIEYRTRTAKGGLGEGYDLLVIDEAQEYADDQETALKYIVTASKNPQTILLGTPPTAVSSGTVFMKFRESALKGELQDAGWAEWSVEKQSDPKDRNLWYETNPSLGTLLTERNITAELTDDPVDFNIQRLGLWYRYELKSAITEAEWTELKAKAMPKLSGPLFVGVKYGKDGANVALSVAVRTTEGQVFVESVDCRSVRSGNAWIIKFLKSASPKKTVIDGASGQQLLCDDIKEAGIKDRPVRPTVKEIILANSMFEQALSGKTITHMAQPSLVRSVSNCEKRAIGSNGGFGYKSIRDDTDISLMDSVILAHWACATYKEAKPQKISY